MTVRIAQAILFSPFSLTQRVRTRAWVQFFLEFNMKCNLKVMLSVAALIAAAAGFAYLTFEEARAGILASLPILAVLLCPISMLVMMKLMQPDSNGDQCSSGTSKPRVPAAEPITSTKELS